jgi:hypothetical protein
LQKGISRSCRCLMRDINRDLHFRHGSAKSKLGSPTIEYRTWDGMWQRVRGSRPHWKKHYRDRGITACERWKIFENFLADMGARPGKGYSIDRINNDGNYEPGNCRWATRSQQVMNRRQQPSKSGIKGVSMAGKKWRVTVCDGSRRINIGRFDSPSEAQAAYEKAINAIS